MYACASCCLCDMSGRLDGVRLTFVLLVLLHAHTLNLQQKKKNSQLTV
jgi:hypothetical protein